MQKTRHHFFRWTPRNARITFMYVLVVPAIVGYVAYKTDVRVAPNKITSFLIKSRLRRLTMSVNQKGLYNFRAKRKGDTIYER